MMASITSIECEAFKAFAARAVLRLDDLPAGLHLVRGRNLTNDRLGSNGAGKSSFFSDAVTWCLYGRTVGGLRTTEVQSWLTEDPPHAAVAIRRGDSEQIVARGPRASALTIDGKTVGQEDVDALMGVDYAAWCQAVVWGQGQPLFFDLAPAAKMALLSDALGLERWEHRAQAAAARARRLEERLGGVEGELRGLDAAREHAMAALRAARDASDEWGRGQAARIEENALATRSAGAAAAALEERRGETSVVADSAALVAREMRPDVGAARERLAARTSDERDHARAIQTWDDKLADIIAQLRAFAEEGTCPTCGQPVAKRDAAKHTRALEAAKQDAEKRRAGCQRQLSAAANEASSLKEQLRGDEQKLREAEETLARVDGELRLLDRELGAAQARAAAARAELARVEAEVNPHRDAAQAARRRLNEIKIELSEKGKLGGRLAASIERAQFWARGFRDIRLGIIDDVLDDLRGTTAEVLDGLGLGDWGVEYTTERETKSGATQRALAVAVRSPAAPAGVRWEAYSGGERQRLRLAGALALSEVLLTHAGAALDFRVLDEPTRGLSREGVRDLVEVLGAYAEAAGLKIFYVDHTSEEGLAFASTVTVTSAEAGARIGD